MSETAYSSSIWAPPPLLQDFRLFQKTLDLTAIRHIDVFEEEMLVTLCLFTVLTKE